MSPVDSRVDALRVLGQIMQLLVNANELSLRLFCGQLSRLFCEGLVEVVVDVLLNVAELLVELLKSRQVVDRLLKFLETSNVFSLFNLELAQL